MFYDRPEITGGPHAKFGAENCGQVSETDNRKEAKMLY